MPHKAEELQSDSDAHQILGVINQFITGWENANPKQVLSTLSKDKGLILIGTDLDEYWQGYESLVKPVTDMTESITDAQYEWGAGEPLLKFQGDIGWAVGKLTLEFGSQQDRTSLVMRTTLVFSRSDEAWKIVHGHFSIGQ